MTSVSMKACCRVVAVLLSLAGIVSGDEGGAARIRAEDYSSIQAAIDANPGRMIRVPQGDHAITKKIHIGRAGGGLYGFGRIIQTDPTQPILEIENAEHARIRDLTLTRADGHREARAPAVLCRASRGVVLESLRVVDNWARDASVEFRASANCTVRDCEIRNYKRVAVDDRTSPDESLYGYAFRAIDGTGILAKSCTGTLIVNNRIVESRLLPTPEVKKKHRLGTLTEGRYPTKQGKLAETIFRNKYANNWHQGSAIMVSNPRTSHHTLVRGNYIENAAQGIDLHTDHAIVSENTIDHGLVGIKGTHGCRNLIISGNLITHVDLWGILLNPGAASHAAQPATGSQPARPANVDAGIIVSNNIITDYGYGNEYWNWGGATNDQGGSYAISLYGGQLETNPPLTDVLIEGNIVYDTGRDKILVKGQPTVVKPRYRYAVYVGSWGPAGQDDPTLPRNLHFANNIFHPGTRGISNVRIGP